MKTFFHPDTPTASVPLAKIAIDHLTTAIRPIRKFCRAHSRVGLAAGCIAFAGLSLAAFFSPESKMPGLVTGKGKELPSQVERAARGVFDGRFVKDGESYYTLIVHYVPNLSSEMAGLNALVGVPQGSASVAPLVTTVELIEIRDIRTEIDPAELQRHDELNKITWKGKVMVKGGVERRRTLDLSAWLKTVSGGDTSSAIPWIEKSVTLDDAKRATGNSAPAGDVMELMSAMLSVITPDFQKELLGYLEGGAWRDWSDCGEICYQLSDLILRDGEVSHSTLEDIDSALGEKSEISLMALHADNYLHLKAMEESGDPVFLTKPDLKALRKAGLIE